MLTYITYFRFLVPLPYSIKEGRGKVRMRWVLCLVTILFNLFITCFKDIFCAEKLIFLQLAPKSCPFLTNTLLSPRWPKKGVKKLLVFFQKMSSKQGFNHYLYFFNIFCWWKSLFFFPICRTIHASFKNDDDILLFVWLKTYILKWTWCDSFLKYRHMSCMHVQMLMNDILN